MKLYSFKIEGFRRHINTEIIFSDNTFLIGENNVGKSSALKALEYFLNGTTKIPEEDFSRVYNKETEAEERIVDKIVLTAEFRDCPREAHNWRGYKGRIFNYELEEQSKESGLCFFYRKTYSIGKVFEGEMREYKRNLKEEYVTCKTLGDFIVKGLDEEIIKEIFPDEKHNKKVTVKEINDLKDHNVSLLFDIHDEEEWFLNPGGIPSNILIRLPTFLLIPAQDKIDELSGNSGALLTTLGSLFNDVRDSSEHFKKAQEHLDLLAQELNPNDENTEFSKLLSDLNKVVSDVFPNTLFNAVANLSDAKDMLKPKFDIKLGSNISTKVDQQGTGVVRSAVFAMLRYRSMRENEKVRKEKSAIRPLFIAFEEPEIYLHPNAALQMRETIYELAQQPLNQIVCTTHSPYMIDLSKKSSQVLNNFQFNSVNIIHNERSISIETILSNAFNISKAFKSLQDDDQTYVKMLLKIDDSIGKIFFVRNILIIEGDTEEIVFKETISRMEESKSKEINYNWQIIKARGKATIISLVKYLKAMGFNPFVIHDSDTGNKNAEKFNKSIQQSVGNPDQIIMLMNCIEDELGYPAPSNNKPFSAFKHVNNTWGEDWSSIDVKWRGIVEKVFFGSINIDKEKHESLKEDFQKSINIVDAESENS